MADDEFMDGRSTMQMLVWAAMWCALGGDPDRVILPLDHQDLPESPAEFAAQVQEMIDFSERVEGELG